MKWNQTMERGRYFLSQKELHKALNCFKKAADVCPFTGSDKLDHALYYLGKTLLMLGLKADADHCWQIASHLSPLGLSETVTGHSGCRGGEDKEVFILLHIEKYLAAREQMSFTDEAERDVVCDILESYWFNLSKDEDFSHFDENWKIAFFAGQDPLFSTFEAPDLFMDEGVLTQKGTDEVHQRTHLYIYEEF